MGYQRLTLFKPRKFWWIVTPCTSHIIDYACAPKLGTTNQCPLTRIHYPTVNHVYFSPSLILLLHGITNKGSHIIIPSYLNIFFNIFISRFNNNNKNNQQSLNDLFIFNRPISLLLILFTISRRQHMCLFCQANLGFIDGDTS